MITLPDTYQLLHFETVDSTNEEAKRLAAQSVMQPHWILADTQSAGRGRRGRAWQSPKGNLMTTIYLPGRIETVKAGQLSFVAGLALADTVASLIGPDGAVSIKWPNDVLVGGAKISGILLESGAASDAHLDWVCVGMGLNLAHYPDDTPYLATSIAAHTGRRPDNLSALEVLASAFDRYYRQWQQFGFSVIVTKWRQQAHNLGREIVVRLEKSELTGVFEDIDDTGALILCTEDGARHIVSAGDVFFR
ncbi:MAG: biotin--[acetyl-CoA-carboxylase] ligase [Parvibaculales bacterium]